jgi:hypothetical protein
MAALEVDIACELVSPNRLMGEHFRSRHWRRRRERRAVAVALEGTTPPPGPRWIVTITRVSSRLLDTDNLQASAKAFRDECADYLGCGDAAKGPITWLYAQRVERVRRAVAGPYIHGKPGPAFRVWCRIRIATDRSGELPGYELGPALV